MAGTSWDGEQRLQSKVKFALAELSSTLQHLNLSAGYIRRSDLKVLTQVLSATGCISSLGKAAEIRAVEVGYISSVKKGKDPCSWKMITNKMLTVEL